MAQERYTDATYNSEPGDRFQKLLVDQLCVPACTAALRQDPDAYLLYMEQRAVIDGVIHEYDLELNVDGRVAFLRSTRRSPEYELTDEGALQVKEDLLCMGLDSQHKVWLEAANPSAIRENAAVEYFIRHEFIVDFERVCVEVYLRIGYYVNDTEIEESANDVSFDFMTDRRVTFGADEIDHLIQTLLALQLIDQKAVDGFIRNLSAR